MIYLVEEFFSIQGEGRHLGTPSLFLRFGGCNMRCEGFGTRVATPDGGEVIGCDTAYAVFKKAFGSAWKKISAVEELLEVVEKYALPYKADIVLTGGEPLLYANDSILAQFLKCVIERGHRVTFETNGAMDVDFERFPIYKACTFALSVKLENSGEPASVRLNFPALKKIISQSHDAFYKFTVPSDHLEGIAAEIKEIIAATEPIDTYCMPLSDSKKSLERACEQVIEFCKQNGYKYSDRLHIRIWDEIQGV